MDAYPDGAIDAATAVALLETLVRIPSPSGAESEAAHWLVGWMQQNGFEAHVDAVGNAVGVRGQGTQRILLLGHIDTFPGMLPVQRAGDWLTGRGSVDAKGALCAFVCAAAALPVAPDWQVIVAGVVEEETASSRGARHLLRTLAPPHCCIIGEPGGWERVTLGYKGRLIVDLHWRAPFAHSAGPQPLPAERAVKLWNMVVAHCQSFNGGRDSAFERLEPALRHIATRDAGAYCDVEMTISFRVPPGLSPSTLSAEVSRWISDDGFALAGCPDTQNGDDECIHVTFSGAEEAFRASKNNRLVHSLLHAIRRAGGTPRFVYKTGTSDMNVVGPVWGVPIVAYGPGDSALDHTPDERIHLDEYLRAIAVLREALAVLQRGAS
ncbi:MAG: [LysW]-lysine hydrolase [Anaerolineae bacterium]|nr:[LysW]-lysine hydrolase [Anaerolineae bacterium]MDW8070082.1 [LysW]-lysine hydrolase [Anaerolineae bacterium]